MTDDETKVVRPKLLVLNAWLKELRERGPIVAPQYCGDDWCKLILMNAGVSEIDATSFAEEYWW